MRLTERQASVYRQVYAEELEYGRAESEARWEAYIFMRDYALRDWQEFWRDWTRKTPTPLETALNSFRALVALQIVASNASRLSPLLEKMCESLRWITNG